MPGQKQPAPPPKPLPPPLPPPQAVDDNEWGLDEAEIEEVYTKLQTPPRPPGREATALLPGQVELTDDDRLCLASIQQREAEGRTRKVTRSSELLPAVVGHNKSEQKQTQRLLRQWYYEQRYQLDKVSNAQRATYRQLRLLHVDRRRQVRELMDYRREEARAEVERERERQQRAKELALLERQLERLREEEAMERRPSGDDQRLKPLRPVKAAARKTREPDAAVAAVAAATAEAVAASQPEPAPVDAMVQQRPQSPLPSNKQEAATQEEMVTMTAKVVEVERRGMRAARQGSEDMTVLERSRSKSFIREVTGTGTKAVQQPPQQPPPLAKSEPPQPPAEPPQPPAPPAHPQRKAAAAAEAAEEPQPPQPAEGRLPLTQVERNRLRARRREEASKRLLLEPYAHYRMSKAGEIEPVEFQPPRFPTTEPSNRPLYEQRKRLQREKVSYVASMNRLGRFTAEVLNESIRLAEALEQPKEVQSKSGPPKELRLGPSDWMKVFIRSNAPEEVEAGSFEAMKFVEYLRPEAPNTNRELEPEKVFEDV